MAKKERKICKFEMDFKRPGGQVRKWVFILEARSENGRGK